MIRSGVPLVVPSRSQLRAGAVWVTIANWAEALERRYGSAPVLTPEAVLTPTDARDHAFGPATSSTGHPPRPRLVTARTAAKDVRQAWRAFSFARSICGPDLGAVPYVWQHHDLFQRAGFRLARRLGVPIVLFVEAPQVWEARQWGVARPGWGNLVERLGERPQLQRADVVACVSDEVADAVIGLGSKPERVLVTPCTASSEMFELGAARASARPRGTGLVVGWVGSFRPFHNVPSLVRAVATVREQMPSVGMLLVGDGPTRQECEDLTRSLAVPTTFTGSVSHRDVPGFINSFDIGVVLSSPNEAFHYSPLKLKEYMAASCAVVAPRAGEIRRVLHDGQDALLYAAGDEVELATAIRTLAAHPRLRKNIGEAGRLRFHSEFRIENQLDQLSQLLQR
jgi:glycosyltransferase involved in cell wall biosynthesis